MENLPEWIFSLQVKIYIHFNLANKLSIHGKKSIWIMAEICEWSFKGWVIAAVSGWPSTGF